MNVNKTQWKNDQQRLHYYFDLAKLLLIFVLLTTKLLIVFFWLTVLKSFLCPTVKEL